jgi:hypothetical protein
MPSIVYVSGSLAPEILQLRLDIVSRPPVVASGVIPFSYAGAT